MEEISLFSENLPEQVRDIVREIIDEFHGELKASMFYRIVKVKMRDNVDLTTHLYFPEETGSWPVILMRNPYNTELPSLFFHKQAQVFAASGFASVIQECRGTGSSEGKWLPFENEKNDGMDTVEWLAKQNWNSGNIGTFGASYLSIDQWLMADNLHPQVKTMYLAVGGTERYRQMYMGGMFRQDIYSMWAVGNSGKKAEKIPETYWKFINYRPHIDADKNVLGMQLPWYRD